MNETKQSSLVSWSGIALFAIGTLGTVLMFLAMKEQGPIDQKGPLGPFAASWTGLFGVFPSLFLNAAFLFLGARLFLKGSTTTLFRNLAACTALAVALSIFFGALSTGAGGGIGTHTGELVATKTHATLGALLGLAAMFAAVWFGWLRGSATGLARTANDPQAARAPSAPVAAPAKPAAKPAAPRIAVVPPTPAEEGVTAAESAALFPLDEPAIESVGAPSPVFPASEAPIAPAIPAPAQVLPAQIPRSPYPEDVRRKGLIPPGAKPLETASASATEAPATSSVYRWTAPGSARDAVVEPEAPASPASSEVREMPVILRSPKSFETIEEDDFEAEELEADELEQGDVLAAEETPAEEADADANVGITAELVEQEPAGTADLPTPSWEQPVLFKPEEGDEEPVDAYGTPRTLVEKLRQARRVGGLERDDHASIDPEMTEERASDTLHRIEEQDLAAEEIETEEPELEDTELEDAELDGDLLDEDVMEPEPAVAVSATRLDELEEFEEFEENADEAPGADDTVDEDAEGELEEEEQGFRPIVRGAKVPRELDVEDAEDADADLEDAEAEPLETAATGERQFELTAPRASTAPKFEPLTPPAIEIATARTEPVQTGLFDAPAPAAAAASIAPLEKRPAEKKPADKKPTEKKHVEKPAAEKEVVLQPVAAVPPERAVKSSAGTMARPKLLSEVGCLFIERGRVAVSMLQRQYEMDFDEACKVLDELQEMGLIGPYLGGQRRDILLTREQWLERVEKAGAAR